MHRQSLVVLVVALASAFSSAGQASVRTVDPYSPSPVEALVQKTLKTSRSKKARTLKSAWSAIDGRQYARARTIATPLMKDGTYGDYAAWLVGVAEQGEARVALKAKNFAAAEKSAQKAINHLASIDVAFPGSPVLKPAGRDLAEAEIIAGDAQVLAKRHKPALVFYQRAFTRLNAISSGALGLIAPASLQSFGEACSKSPDDTCAAWVTRLASIHPKSSEEYKGLVRGFAPPADKLRPAGVSRATQSYKSPDLDQIAFEEILDQILKGKHEDAIKTIGVFMDTFPRSTHRFRARYWLAQSLARDKQGEKAKKAYDDLAKDSPLTWYGLLATLAAGGAFGSTITDAVVLKAVDNDPFLQPSEIRRLRRARELLAESAPELAVVELQDARPREQLSTPFLAYLAALCNEARAFSTSFVLITEIIQRGTPEIVSSTGEKLIFPMPYLQLIQKHAAEYDLDPLLLISLIKQESAFNVDAVSGSGAMGLMQLMPGTAIGTQAGVTRLELHQADANIHVGAKYLKQLLNRFHGNIALALAAYNAGPGSVNRWLRENPKRPMLEFIEGIPYKETREYVGAIIRNYFWYSRRMGKELPKDLGFFWGDVAPAAKADDVDPAENPVDEVSPK